MTHMANDADYGHKCIDSDIPGVNGSAVIGHPGPARVTSSIWVYEWSDADEDPAEGASAPMDFAEALAQLVSFVHAGDLEAALEDRGVEMLAVEEDKALARLLRAAEHAKAQGVRDRLLAQASRRIQAGPAK